MQTCAWLIYLLRFLVSVQFLQSSGAVELFIVKVSVCRRAMMCGLKVLDFRSAHKGLRVGRLTNLVSGDAGDTFCVCNKTRILNFSNDIKRHLNGKV